MKFLLKELEARRLGTDSVYNLSALQRSYGCKCSSAVFFGNNHCLNCDTPLGYEPHLGKVFSLAPGTEPGTWLLAGPNVPDDHSIAYRRCANSSSAASCNWLVPVEGLHAGGFCISCRLNRTIPDLSLAENAILWKRIEEAKRRVISALVALNLPIESRLYDDPFRALAFDFLRSPVGGPRVLTGHDRGIITLNVEEADDVKREQIRTQMREPYRTLVGHFRHEVGHYYWDRLVSGSQWIASFRGLFGDERANYEAALQSNYLQGPTPGWQGRFISSYASIHPWEDWAETWAHYMHMVDTLGTALSFGLKPEMMSMPFDCFGTDALFDPQQEDASNFLSFLNSWLKLTSIMNELCRSMGQPDFYPFALPRAAVKKLHFIHMVVAAEGSAG